MASLDWTGKSAVLAHHEQVPVRLLQTDTALSFGAPDTGNLVIEGDNLEALQALRAHYEGRVKCVFIDPPYNTGNEGWSYNDNANSPDMHAWLQQLSGADAQGWSRHDKWLSMIYPRLRLVRDLLTPDGVIWVAIDDNEQHHLRAVMDEIFGEDQFLGTVIWERSDAAKAAADHFSIQHDYILCYAKDEGLCELAGVPSRRRTPEPSSLRDDEGRPYYLRPLRALGGNGDPQGDTAVRHAGGYFAITAPDGAEVWPDRPDGFAGAWRWSRSKVEREAGTLEWRREDSGWTPYYRVSADHGPCPQETIWTHEECGGNKSAYLDLKRLFQGQRVFETPKPEQLLARIIAMSTRPGDIVLDCFAGLGATGAVAHKMGRRYLLAEMTASTCRRIAERLCMIVDGADAHGVTTTLGWRGGGGFQYCRLGRIVQEADGRRAVGDLEADAAAFEIFRTQGVPASQAVGKAPGTGRRLSEKDGVA